MRARADDHETPTGAYSDSQPRSRRAVLAAAAGGAAALAALLTRPARMEAAAGSPLVVGSVTNNAGTSNTLLTTNSNVVAFQLLQNGPGTALMGYAFPSIGSTRGIYGRTNSPNGDGVQARNAGASVGTGAAVRAFGGHNIGVIGLSDENTGIHGEGFNLGVFGFSSAGAGVSAESDTGVGVFGNAQLGTAGVAGQSSTGTGVYGKSDTSYGVRGESFDGPGVWGQSGANSGVLGTSGEGTGYAIEAVGHMKVSEYLDVFEMTAPATPANDRARLFVRDTAGKTELCVLFNDGVVQVLAAQP